MWQVVVTAPPRLWAVDVSHLAHVPSRSVVRSGGGERRQQGQRWRRRGQGGGAWKDVLQAWEENRVPTRETRQALSALSGLGQDHLDPKAMPPLAVEAPEREATLQGTGFHGRTTATIS